MFQLSTVNKVIQILLVGAFFVGGFVLIMAPNAAMLLNAAGITTTAATGIASPLIALFAVLLLPIAIFVGLLLDGLAEITTRPLFGLTIAKSPMLKKLLGEDDDCDAYVDLKQLFMDLLLKDARLGPVANALGRKQGDADCDWIGRTLGVALLFESKTKDAIDWAVQHQSFFRLASAFMVAVVLLWIPAAISFVMSSHLIALAVLLLISLLALPVLAKVSAANALYAYEIVFRHGIFTLCERTGDASTDAATGQP